MKEKSLEALKRGKEVYDKPRFMSVSLASRQLLEIISLRRNSSDKDEKESVQIFNENSTCVGLARIGSETQSIVSCTLEQMSQVDLGAPLHTLVIPGNLHPLETEMLQLFSLGSK